MDGTMFLGSFTRSQAGLRPSAVVYNLHAYLHKSIPIVSHSLSAKRVLTDQKMFYFTHQIFKHEIHCEKLNPAHAYCSQRY